MAISRILQTGFEWGNSELISLFPFAVATVPTIWVGAGYTGNQSLRQSATQEGRWHIHTTTLTQARASMMFWCDGVAIGDVPGIMEFDTNGSGTPIATLRYDHGNTQLEALCGATEVATYSIDLTDSAWRQIAMDVKIDGAAGWFYVYVDGVEVIGFDGDTNDGGANFNSFLIGSNISTQNWNEAIIDDVYFDSTTGEGSPSAPPLLRFYMHKPNGDGNYSNWLGSDGNSVNNYLLVDEDPPAIADYVEHDTTTEQDTYTTAFDTEDVPNGAIIQAVIPTAFARHEDGTLELKLMTREDSVDDVGSAQALTAGYEVYWERFLLDPSSGAWTKTTVDAMEIGVYVE